MFLDADLPPWVPIPPLAEVQVALEQAVAEITDLSGYELKRIMRTGDSGDNRQPELGAARLFGAGGAVLAVTRHRA
jgi:AMP nucleosidase